MYSDARGNLIQVDEHNSSSTYTTTYTWNLNGKLLSITDALSNSRAFTYDGLGNRLTAEDLHASGDSTFGSWSYTYDNAGNMTQSVSPEAKTVNYTYDAVNRQLTENYSGVGGTEITYAYDSCTNGVGKLCSITMTSGANTAYTYDSNGNTASEAKTINSTAYTTSYTYDRQGNTLIITYPDSAQVRYTYNTAGLLNQIERKESGGSFTNVISNIDYFPTDQPITLAYANGVTNTNTYDASNLYRLSNKTTSTYSYIPSSNNNPVITLTGATLINKNVGESWSEPGYSATDTEDGTITSYVSTTGSVNTSVAGTYQLVYNVTDSGGAPAAAKIRTVVVHSANANPVITLTGSTLINLNVGDTFTEPGYSATDTEDGTITGSVSVTGSVNTSVAGTYILIYNVNDSGGAPAAAKARTVVIHANTNFVQALVVGGGGGGGSTGGWYPGGGGGAGGYQYNASYAVTPQSYSITVGSGGSANSNGNDSVFGTITAYGGGKGGTNPSTSGANGGSGGGGSTNTSYGTGSQGGNGSAGGGSQSGGGGGSGGSASGTGFGSYGVGTANSITGSSVTYAIGGTGSPYRSANGTTGGGYGGGGGAGGGTGGGVTPTGNGGVVIISYLTANFGTCTGGTKTTSGSYTIHTFSSNGSFTLVAPLQTIIQ